MISVFPINARLIAANPAKFFFPRQHICFEGLHPRSQRHPTFLNLHRTEQPECRILREPFGIVDTLIACYPTVN